MQDDVPRLERLAMVERQSKITVSRQCELLSLCRAGVYYVPKPVTEFELLIKRYIDEIYTELPVYGSRRIAVEIGKRHEVKIDRRTVSKYMREMGISAIYPKPNLSKPSKEHKIYPYLLGNLVIDHPNQVWASDTTYIRMLGGFMYLTAIMDWFSRYVISWILADTLEIEPVLETARIALATSKPEIMNTDQGSDFTSPQYTELFLNQGVLMSMDHRGRCFDNIMVERLWRSVKYEKVFISDFRTPRELSAGITEYFEHYNNRRGHQSLGYNYPADVYMGKVKI
jgi:putative transposase